MPAKPAGHQRFAPIAATPGTEKAGAATSRPVHVEGLPQAAAKVLPSVVMITNTPAAEACRRRRPATPGQVGRDALRLQGIALRRSARQSGVPPFLQGVSLDARMPRHAGSAGSGVIVDPSGIVLTNNHVVAGGGQITVRLQDGREFKAVDVKTDPKTDLAILRIHGAGTLPAARLGNSDQMKSATGSWPSASRSGWKAPSPPASSAPRAAASASPTARTSSRPTPPSTRATAAAPWSISTARSSASTRPSRPTTAATKASASPFPSIWPSGSADNWSNGKVHRAYLGVGIQPVTQSLAEQFNARSTGVLVTEVRAGTPAAKAGLKPGDIILRFAGKRSPARTSCKAWSKRPGSAAANRSRSFATASR